MAILRRVNDVTLHKLFHKLCWEGWRATLRNQTIFQLYCPIPDWLVWNSKIQSAFQSVNGPTISPTRLFWEQDCSVWKLLLREKHSKGVVFSIRGVKKFKIGITNILRNYYNVNKCPQGYSLHYVVSLPLMHSHLSLFFSLFVFSVFSFLICQVYLEYAYFHLHVSCCL